MYGGGSGIRTHETVTRLPVFKTGAFNRSAIPPELSGRLYSPVPSRVNLFCTLRTGFSPGSTVCPRRAHSCMRGAFWPCAFARFASCCALA